MSSIIGAMDLKFSTDQLDSYQIDTPVYQGPLDLLLQLIENAELDITSLALAQVTDQYLKRLESLTDLPPDEISAFLVIAAKLIQIKSEALLPHKAGDREEEVDLGNELAKQLIAYKRYKEIADILAERKDLGFQSYIRLAPPGLAFSEKLDLEGFGLKELYALAANILQKNIERQSISTVVERPKITIKDKINYFAVRFQNAEHLTFQELLGDTYTRLDIVISFLALLELIRGNFIQVVQTMNFDQIQLTRVKSTAEMQDFALRNLEL